MSINNSRADNIGGTKGDRCYSIDARHAVKQSVGEQASFGGRGKFVVVGNEEVVSSEPCLVR